MPCTDLKVRGIILYDIYKMLFDSNLFNRCISTTCAYSVKDSLIFIILENVYFDVQ